jgi:hypothetical protein
MGKMRDRVKKRANENKNKGRANLYELPDGIDVFKPKAKTYSLDILPYVVSVDTHPEVEKGELWFERTVWIHYNVDESARICPRTVKKPCPVCEERKELMKEEGDEDLIDQLKAKERLLYNVIDLDNQDKGIQILDISYHCFQKQLDEEIREGKDEYADFAELKGGKTLKVRFAQESLGGNKFQKTSRIDFKDRKDYKKDILEEVVDLDKILIIRDYDDLERELHGVEPEDKEEKEDKVAKERERRRAEREKKKEDKEEGPECPHGHEFGVDTDKYKKDCDDCELWVECDDAKEAREAKD